MDSNYLQGERGDHFWTTEWYTTTVNGRPIRRSRLVRKTRWTFVSGQFTRFFDDVLVPAGKEGDFESAFRLSELQPFEVQGVLAGLGLLTGAILRIALQRNG